MRPNIHTEPDSKIDGFIQKGSEELNIKARKRGNKFLFYFYGERIGYMSKLLSSTTSKIAFKICKNKMMTEKLLNDFNISTLESKFYNDQEFKKAHDSIMKSKHNRFVIKPTKLASGKGMELNVNKNNFFESWNRCVQYQREKSIEEIDMIVQPFIDGFDIRIAITEGVFSSALWRLPAHVIGDGSSNIESLIQDKNHLRKQTLYFKRFLYDLNNEKLQRKLREQNFDLNSVPEMNSIVFLSDLGNLTAGAESIDITPYISDELKVLALKATAAIPGLQTAGVDILTEDFTADSGYVIEVNTNANHQVHHLPYKGKVRKPFKDIMNIMLVKHKIKKQMNLKPSEKKINERLQKFNEYRSSFYLDYLAKSFFAED